MELEQASILILWSAWVDYIIPIWNWSYAFLFDVIRTLLYYYIIPIWNWSMYCIRISCLYQLYYIIPIWNWSLYLCSSITQDITITLFLYGIGACYISPLVLLFQHNYIIPIWNWSYDVLHLAYGIYRWLHYSYMELEHSSSVFFNYFYFYYIIPIWNWSQDKVNPVNELAKITLFLYGIGAFCCKLKYSDLFIITLFLYGIGAMNETLESLAYYWLHYSYMELEL